MRANLARECIALRRRTIKRYRANQRCHPGPEFGGVGRRRGAEVGLDGVADNARFRNALVARALPNAAPPAGWQADGVECDAGGEAVGGSACSPELARLMAKG